MHFQNQQVGQQNERNVGHKAGGKSILSRIRRRAGLGGIQPPAWRDDILLPPGPKARRNVFSGEGHVISRSRTEVPEAVSPVPKRSGRRKIRKEILCADHPGVHGPQGGEKGPMNLRRGDDLPLESEAPGGAGVVNDRAAEG